MRRHALFAATLLIASLPSGAARAEDDPHAGCVAPPSYVPAALLERPLPLRRGVGNSRETVTTGSQEAQAYYDQGLNYVESYVWIEAARSFHQALRLDPKLALAYVGLSRVQSGLGNDKAARLMLERAKALGSGASDRERRRITIREKQLDAIDRIEDTAAFAAYKKAIDDALVADLGDPQLWLMRGTAEESNASGRGQRGNASSVAFYERALQLVPDHASAHHYLVHSYETIGRIEDALVHGEAYARLSPAIPHAAHMWATTCAASGAWTRRSSSSSRSTRWSGPTSRPSGWTRASTGTTATTWTCSRPATSTRDRWRRRRRSSAGPRRSSLGTPIVPSTPASCRTS